MAAIEKQGRELLAAEYRTLGIEPQAARLMGQGHQPGGVHYAAVKAIIAALTPPEGFVLVPVEATDEMYAAALDRVKKNTVRWADGGTLVRDLVGHTWAAMLAARP